MLECARGTVLVPRAHARLLWRTGMARRCSAEYVLRMSMVVPSERVGPLGCLWCLAFAVLVLESD